MSANPGLVHAVLEAVAGPVSLFVITVAAIQNLIYSLQLVIAYFVLHSRTYVRGSARTWQMLSQTTRPISLLVPAYNEAATIIENIRSLLALHYPNFEVIVINDGSTDQTLHRVIDEFGLEPVVRPCNLEVPHAPIIGLYGSHRYPNLLLADKRNGGKADALNAGINLSRFPLFCAVDADSLLESDALLRAVQPFAEGPDRVAAVGGTVRIANGCKVRAGRVTDIDIPRQAILLFQVVEYLRAFLMARIAWSRLNALMLVSGAFGIFRRQPVVEAGGYDTDTVGEDLELIVKLHRHLREKKVDYEIRYVSDPVCWTEAPASLIQLGRQRMRWQRGALETFFKHRRMLFNPRYGSAGLIGYPHMLMVDVLGPPIEILGYLLVPAFWYLGALSTDFFAAYLALTFVYGVFISVGALFLEELELKRYPRPSHLLILTMAAVMENFGYRQLNNFWRMAGFWQFAVGRKGAWGDMARSGFARHEGTKKDSLD